MHSVKRLFTKFTILFTIQIPCTERYQSNFAGSTLIGYENKKMSCIGCHQNYAAIINIK